MALLHQAKRTKREKKFLDVESQEKGEEVATSMPNMGEAGRKQLESSQKMDWREYLFHQLFQK